MLEDTIDIDIDNVESCLAPFTIYLNNEYIGCLKKPGILARNIRKLQINWGLQGPLE